MKYNELSFFLNTLFCRFLFSYLCCCHDFWNDFVVVRYHDQESVRDYVEEVIRDLVTRRQPMDNVSRNVLRVLGSTCGISEIRLLVAQRLELWIQNPKVLATGLFSHYNSDCCLIYFEMLYLIISAHKTSSRPVALGLYQLLSASPTRH